MSRVKAFKPKKSEYLKSLDFEVIKAPILVQLSEENYIKDTKRVAIVNDKTETVISYMSPAYRLFTNEEFCRFTERIGETFSLDFNHYAIHNDGQRVLAVFDKTDQVYKVGDYEFKNHVVLYDSRDGGTKLSVGGAGNLNRCANMFTSTKVQFSVNHSYKLDEMLSEFELGLDRFAANQKEYLQRLERLQDIKVSREDLYTLIGGWVQLKPSEVKLVAEGRHHGVQTLDELSTRKTNIISGINSSYNTETRALGETGFGLFNTVTHYYTHNREKDIKDLLFGDFGTKEKETIAFAESLVMA